MDIDRKQQIYILAALLSLATAITGCSNRQLYQAIQENRLQACEELPIPQQKACQQQYQMPYDQYRREREELTP